jgi:hypothetical protein
MKFWFYHKIDNNMIFGSKTTSTQNYLRKLSSLNKISCNQMFTWPNGWIFFKIGPKTPYNQMLPLHLVQEFFFKWSPNFPMIKHCLHLHLESLSTNRRETSYNLTSRALAPKIPWHHPSILCNRLWQVTPHAHVFDHRSLFERWTRRHGHNFKGCSFVHNEHLVIRRCLVMGMLSLGSAFLFVCLFVCDHLYKWWNPNKTTNTHPKGEKEVQKERTNVPPRDSTQKVQTQETHKRKQWGDSPKGIKIAT